jgi:ankyrin repeat protein
MQHGDTPLQIAFRHGHLAVVELLLYSGADANKGSDYNVSRKELIAAFA